MLALLDGPATLEQDESMAWSAELAATAEARLLEAFTEVRDRLLRALRGLLGNEHDAQDALQTGFLRCWQAREDVPGLENVPAWVWRVSLNAGRDLYAYLRRRRTEPLGADEPAAPCHGLSPAEALVAQEELERVQAALGRLRPEEQEVFILRQQHELSYGEIARLRGSPLNTGKTLMRRALLKLRQALQEDEEDQLTSRDVA